MGTRSVSARFLGVWIRGKARSGFPRALEVENADGCIVADVELGRGCGVSPVHLELNRVQLETRSANLPKPLGGRRSDPKSTGLELDAV